MSRHKFSPNRIYNLDGIGKATARVPLNIIRSKGKRQVKSVTWADSDKRKADRCYQCHWQSRYFKFHYFRKCIQEADYSLFSTFLFLLNSRYIKGVLFDEY